VCAETQDKPAFFLWGIHLTFLVILCKAASQPEEVKSLLEVGFEYVGEKDGLVFFRKRK